MAMRVSGGPILAEPLPVSILLYALADLAKNASVPVSNHIVAYGASAFLFRLPSTELADRTSGTSSMYVRPVLWTRYRSGAPGSTSRRPERCVGWGAMRIVPKLGYNVPGHPMVPRTRVVVISVVTAMRRSEMRSVVDEVIDLRGARVLSDHATICGPGKGGGSHGERRRM